MSPPYQFEAVYDHALASAAAWTFAKRRLTGSRSLWIAMAAVALFEAACALWLASLWPLLVLPALILLLGGLSLGGWLAHRAAALRKLRALGAGHATFTFDEDALSVETKAGATRLAWAAIDEVWEYPAFWIVRIAENAYFTVPTTSAPPEALDFARARLGDRLS